MTTTMIDADHVGEMNVLYSKLYAWIELIIEFNIDTAIRRDCYKRIFIDWQNVSKRQGITGRRRYVATWNSYLTREE